MSSLIMIGVKGEGDIETKDKESRNIWYEVPEFKTHLECDIPKELWDN